MQEKKKPGPKPGTRTAGKPKGWKKYDEPVVQIHLRLPKSLADELRALPGTVTENIRSALDAYIAEQGLKKE